VASAEIYAIFAQRGKRSVSVSVSVSVSAGVRTEPIAIVWRDFREKEGAYAFTSLEQALRAFRFGLLLARPAFTFRVLLSASTARLITTLYPLTKVLAQTRGERWPCERERKRESTSLLNLRQVQYLRSD